jgi:hypothetical protein
MSNETKTNTARASSEDLTQEERASALQIAQNDEGESDSAGSDSVQMRAARKIMRENAEALKMLADS